MGFFHSSFLAYGVQIPDTDSGQLEDGLSALDGQQRGEKKDHVGFLHAGRYDREDTFLVTACTEAEIGAPVVVAPERATAEQYADWNHNLGHAARALGLTEPPEPSWLLITHIG